MSRYHHNYYVHDSKKIYYQESPTIVQIGDHYFIEVQVLELFINAMLFGW